jgi:hypothetical protein
MEDRKVKQVLSGVGTRGWGGGYKERVNEGKWYKYYVLMYGNGKMRPVETILGSGEEG